MDEKSHEHKSQLEDEAAFVDLEPNSTESIWRSCCFRCSPSATRYFSVLGLCSTVIVFSAAMIAAHPKDLEIRANFLPLISGTLMLFIEAPRSSENS
jgi:hypothetical protein